MKRGTFGARRGLGWQAFWALGLAAMLVPSCGGSTAEPGSDSNTHWLSKCGSDADCGGLSCVCGSCSRRCDSDESCGTLPGATCAVPATCDAEATATATACVRACTVDLDCQAIRKDLVCSTGQCEPALSNDRCAAMDVQGDGTPCIGPRSYAWNGRYCQNFSCPSCVGADCGRVFATLAECDEAHDACYQAEGLERECLSNADCRLEFRGCCASCVTAGPGELIGVRSDQTDIASSAPGFCDASCPACVGGGIDPTVEARCTSGRCSAEPVLSCAGLDEATCQATSGCEAVIGSATGPAGARAYAGCRYIGDRSISGACDATPSCAYPANDPQGCLWFPTTACVPDAWTQDISCSREGCPAL